MKSVLETQSLSIINSIPTYFFNTGSSLLDICIVKSNKISKIKQQQQLGFCSLSKHDMLCMSYDCSVPPLSIHEFFYRDYSKLSEEKLFGDVVALQWNHLYSIVDINDKLNFFNGLILQLFDSNIPIKSKVLNKNPTPWFNDSVRRAIVNRDNAFKNFKKCKDSAMRLHLYDTYKTIRNQTTQLVRNAKIRFCSSRLSTNLTTKQLYNNIRKFGLISNDNFSPNFTSDELNSYFITASSSSFNCNFDIQTNNNDGFSFSNVHPNEVLIAITNIKSNAVGIDEIPVKFIKLLLPYILPYITHIFNSILTSSDFPIVWKTAKIIPIHKNSKSHDLKDFRPISLLSSLSKALESILSKQITNYLNANNFLVDYQSGFRKNHSTESALLHVSDSIRVSTDKKLMTALLLLDFSKAFDTINHNLLLYKLAHNFNFSNSSISLIKSYLSNRQQSVFADNVLSNRLVVKAGVPQGSILGPLLFSLFINDLPSVLHYCSYHLYADDFQVYLSGNKLDFNSTIDKLNYDLNEIYKWSLSNGLTLNFSKTQALIINNKSNYPLSDIKIHNTTVVVTENITNLGVIFDSQLNFRDHINYTTNRIFGILARLWKFSSFTPRSVRKKLIIALCMPLFNYCSVVIGTLDSYCKRKYDIAFNTCLRYIYGLRKYDSISDFRKNILGCDLHNYLKFRTCCFLYKLIDSKTPKYLYNKINFGRSTRTRCLIPHTNFTAQLNSSFFIRAIVIWNSLPIRIKWASSFGMFRTHCLLYFCERQ